MRIAIMGSGGIGGYVGARLQDAGEEVVFIARGEHLAAMRKKGLRIDSPFGDLHLPDAAVTDAPQHVGPTDIVLFTVKLFDTEEAAAALAPMMAPHTRVITLQNGIDSIDMISKHVPRHQVIGGVIYLSAVISEPGVIRTTGGPHRMIIGDDGSGVVHDFHRACQRATGINCEVIPDIGTALWEKFVRLSAFSGATSLLRSSIGAIVNHPETRTFLRELVSEGATIAAATGNPLPTDFIEAAIGLYADLPPEMTSSMANDLKHGKRLELNWLSGRIHALGLGLGIPTPAHSAVYRGLILHANGSHLARG